MAARCARVCPLAAFAVACLPKAMPSRVAVASGAWLDDGLALGQLPGFARWLSPQQLLEIYPELPAEGLKGGWHFWDGQMDE